MILSRGPSDQLVCVCVRMCCDNSSRIKRMWYAKRPNKYIKRRADHPGCGIQWRPILIESEAGGHTLLTRTHSCTKEASSTVPHSLITDPVDFYYWSISIHAVYLGLSQATEKTISVGLFSGLLKTHNDHYSATIRGPLHQFSPVSLAIFRFGPATNILYLDFGHLRD